jgi:tRNA A-37 threonylcarbamoyl transferase component Bud32
MATIQEKRTGRGGRCIALYPGAFRPPHAAHLTAVLDLAERPDVDQVVVIISNRCRSIPGTTQALDADVARRIWSIYLAGIPKVRIEVAPHTSVKHALGYFDRVETGDTLLFCIGEADAEQGDERFEQIEDLSSRTGILARLVPAPTGSITVRATDLRTMLALGEAGRDAFTSTLPARLTIEQRAHVWDVCRDGMRETGDIIRKKVREIIETHDLGDIQEIRSVCGGKLDQVYRVSFKDGQRYFAKYAGDTVGAECVGENLRLKPKRRLSAERRALSRMRDNGIDEVDLPDVVLFDKETLTLVLTEVCPGGTSLLNDLKKGLFDPRVAGQASHFLARCHTLAAPIAPVWGDRDTDRLHWQTMLALRTVGIKTDVVSESIRNDLASLKRASETASEQAGENSLFMLDDVPKNILLGTQRIGVIDFELCSSSGDPAYDLGLFLGDYILFGLITGSSHSGQIALREALKAYRQRVGNRWMTMRSRVVSFAGAAMLYHLMDHRRMDIQPVEPRIVQTATALLSSGLREVEEIDSILSSAMSGRFT